MPSRFVFLAVVLGVLASAWGQMPPGPPLPGPPGPGGPAPPPPGPGPAGPAPPGSPPPGMSAMGGGYNPQVQSSHCHYLIDAPSPWGTNASPFRLYTRSHSGIIRRGYPIEVSILPQYDAFKYFNFTDFALWAEPHLIMSHRPAAVEPEKARYMPMGASPTPPGPNDITHLGVWQVFSKYAGGASTLKCNSFTQGEDTVGSFEERMLELLKAQFPFDHRLFHFHPSARHGAAFLWYPDERCMGTVYSIKFVAKVKSFGQWFRLESGHWRVNRPPPPRRFIGPAVAYNGETREYPSPPSREPFQLGAFLDTYQNMRNRLRYMEHRLEKAGAPGV